MTTSPSPTYQVSDLAGCDVVTEKGESLGQLVDVLPSGGNDIFVVKNGNREILIPALQNVVQHIDLIKKRLDVVLPNGLRELYESL